MNESSEERQEVCMWAQHNVVVAIESRCVVGWRDQETNQVQQG